MIAKRRTRCDMKRKKQKVDEENIFVVFTDGSADNLREPHYGGAAFVIIDPKKDEIIEQYSEGFRNVTNNQMELHAIIQAMKTLPDNSTCGIFTDSKYSIYVLDHKTCTFNKNMEYIQEFRDTVEMKNIKYQFKWIRGHQGNKWNEYVDKLANDAFTKMGGRLIDFKKFKADNDYKLKQLNMSKYLNICLNTAKDFIPSYQFEEFEKELSVKFQQL